MTCRSTAASSRSPVAARRSGGHPGQQLVCLGNWGTSQPLHDKYSRPGQVTVYLRNCELPSSARRRYRGHIVGLDGVVELLGEGVGEALSKAITPSDLPQVVEVCRRRASRSKMSRSSVTWARAAGFWSLITTCWPPCITAA